MRRILFFGNCQANRFASFYREFIAPVTGDEVLFRASFAPAQAGDQQIECDIIISQVTDFDQAANAGDVASAREVIPFPNVTGMFLWPGLAPHPDNAPQPDLPAGPFPRDMGDRFLNSLVLRYKAGESAEDLAQEYSLLDIASAGRVQRLVEIALEQQARRDEQCGYATGRIISEYLTRQPLFLTPSTFHMPLFSHIFLEICARLSAPIEASQRALDSHARAPFPDFERPIHPSIARLLGMSFIRPNQRFVFYTGEMISIEEYSERYIRYEWNAALLRAVIEAERASRDYPLPS